MATLGLVVNAAADAKSDALRDKVIACAKINIAALDDGVSPASDIAAAAHDNCRKEMRASYLYAVSGLDADTRRGFDNAYNPERIFTMFVLRDRAHKREALTSQ